MHRSFVGLRVALQSLVPVGKRVSLFYVSCHFSASIFYSIACDPLWSTVAAVSWSVPFVAGRDKSSSHQTCQSFAVEPSVSVLLFCLCSGALLYLYTLTQYTARVYFSALLERPFAPSYVSMLLSSPYAKYLLWALRRRLDDGGRLRRGSCTCARRSGPQLRSYLIFGLRGCIHAAGCCVGGCRCPFMWSTAWRHCSWCRHLPAAGARDNFLSGASLCFFLKKNPPQNYFGWSG